MDARSLDFRRGGRHRWRRPIRPGAGRRVAARDRHDAAGVAPGGRGPVAPGRDARRRRSGGDRPVDAGDPRPGRRGRVDRDSGTGPTPRSTVRCRRPTRSTSATTTANGIEDEGEETIVWYYWLVDRDARAGVTVRSTRPPEALFTFRGSGILIDEPRYPREVYAEYGDEASRAGLTIEPAVVLDTTNGLAGARTPISLDAPLPRTGTPVELTGARLGVVRRGLLARSERRQGVRLRRAGPVRGARLRPRPPGTPSGCSFATTRSSPRRPR